MSRHVNFACRIHPVAQSDIGEQQWVTRFHCVCEVLNCRLVDSVPRWRLSLSWPIQSDHLSIGDQMIPPSGWEHFHGKTQYIPGKKVLVRSCLWKIYFIYYFMCRKMQMCVVWVYDHSKVRMSENPRLPVVIQWTESVPSG